ncbi:MAG: hypothetical protein AAF066_05110 [Pseudomonadota bacterium]
MGTKALSFLKYQTVLLCLAGQASLADELTLLTNPFQEDLRPAAEISGALIMGVQRKSGTSQGVSLTAYLPKDWAGATLCARVASVDGLYEASNEYAVTPEWTGGTTSLPYPTKFGDDLSQRPTPGLGIRVTRGSCTDTGPQDATIAGWNAASDAPLELLINSFRADTVFMYAGDAPTPAECKTIALDNLAAYDTICPLEALDSTGPVTLEIHRIVNRKPAKPTQVTVWLPAS